MALNVKIGVEYQMILIVVCFNDAVQFNFGHLQDVERVGWFHYKTCTAICTFFNPAENKKRK